MFALPHVWVLFGAGLVSLAVAWVSWRRRGVSGARILAWAMVATAVWTIFSGFEAAVMGQPDKILFSKLGYLGFTTVPALMLMFVLVYTRQAQPFSWKFLLAYWLLPALTLGMVWTNELHGLIWSSFSPGPVEENVLVYHHGAVYWVYTAYLYAVALGINLVLFRKFRQTQGIFRMQILTMAIGSLFPALAGAVYLLNINPIHGLDWTPVSMVGTGAAFAWSVFRLNLLDLMPVARETLIEQIQDGIVVLDPQDRVVDLNPAARLLLSLKATEAIGQPVDAIFSTALPDLDPSTSIEIRLEGNHPKDLEMRTTLLYGPSDLIAGRLLLLYDITRRKEVEQSLQEANRLLQEQLERNRSLQAQLREEAIRDPLTGLFNRRYLDEMLVREISRAVRESKPVSFLLLDADHFKRINDSFGHQTGDIVLQKLAEIIRLNTRCEDIACRFGGDEFIIIMPGADSQAAGLRAEALRIQFDSAIIPEVADGLSFSFSAGVATFPVHGDNITSIIRACDEALYSAKSNGRNRVEVWGQTPPGQFPS